MNQQELFDLCLDRINAWNEGELFADEPILGLTLQRPKLPTGETIRLYGNAGPRGRIARVAKRDKGFMVVAYFPAVPIARELKAEFDLHGEIPPISKTIPWREKHDAKLAQEQA